MSRRARRHAATEVAQSGTTQRPWDSGEDGASFGSWLRQQREIRNITLREISDSTKVGMRYLAALEDDRFELLPAPIFARGFLREYAKFVGLDADEVVNFYLVADQQYRAALEDADDEQLSTATTESPLKPILVIVGAVTLVLVGVFMVSRIGEKREQQAAERPPTIAPPVIDLPAPQPQAEPVEAAATGPVPITVTLGFTDECWVEAVIDDDTRISELRVQGESMQLEAQERLVLTLGNPSAVRVEVNGSPLEVEASPGQVVRELVIDRESAGLEPVAPGGAASRPDDAAQEPDGGGR